MSAVETDVREIKGILQRIEPLVISTDKRVQKVEDGLTKLSGDFVKLGHDTSELKGRVSQLPTTLTMIMAVLGILAIAGVTKIFSH